ncbi:SMC-Scp complex subunit ScpB [Candidatus Spyradosoma sp. SGI.093]|uniref:SMC-Scp complex subunit ScpB n=1 Tax=Candidatus Spyradosoma sp. SGI.093 TaxID=3420583 RepID=UPI003D077F32
MEFNLKKILKALLASTSEPLSIKDVQAVVTRYHEQREKSAQRATAPETDEAGVPVERAADADEPEQRVIEDIINQVPTLLTATQIREAVEELNQEMKETRDATRIVVGPEGFRMTISPDYAEWIRLLRNDPKPQRLTAAALETLAIVAYRQPVTRAEMEALRGVSVDSAISRLLELELITVSGRADLPGRPSQFSTTPKFLEFVGLQTISELPESDVLSPAQISAWIQKAMNPNRPTNADVGLHVEDAHPAAQLEIAALEDAPAPADAADATPPPEPAA